MVPQPNGQLIGHMAILFLLCLGAVVYTYAGHPLLLWCLSRFRPRPWEKGVTGNSVAVFVAAYNEEKALPGKLKNLLEQDFEDPYTIVVANDGSSDRTAEIARAFEERSSKIRLFDFSENRGKSWMQNSVVPRLECDVVVFSDATSRWKSDTLRRIMENFASPDVGGVGVDLTFVTQSNGTVEKGQGAYWRFERFLRQHGALAGTNIVVSGTCYAMRKRLFTELPLEVAEDLANPLIITAKGMRVVFDHTIKVEEWSNVSHADEVGMRVRVALQNIAGLFRYAGHLHPQYGFAAYQLFAHKYLRASCWVFLVGAAILNVLLLGEPLFGWVFAAQTSFYATAGIGWWRVRGGDSAGPASLPYYFCLLNFSYVVALVKFLRGERKPTWEPTR